LRFRRRTLTGAIARRRLRPTHSFGEAEEGGWPITLIGSSSACSFELAAIWSVAIPAAAARANMEGHSWVCARAGRDDSRHFCFAVTADMAEAVNATLSQKQRC
jgi:hypothetical protein